MSGPAAVLDASAVLAFLFDESGAETTQEYIDRSVISTVNWTEVAQVCHAVGSDVAEIRISLASAGLTFAPLELTDAEAAAALREPTRSLGLSLADRCCLALATRLGLPAVTANRKWTSATEGQIILIR